jgi:ribosome biogenesis GTPase / thiamine phosphate phosphatase
MEFNMKLEQLGWNEYFNAAFSTITETGLVPARIRKVERGHFCAVTSDGEYDSVLSGSLRHNTADENDFVVIGDWVLLSLQTQGPSIIEHVLPRKTFISRKEAGETSRVQPIAANIDTLFILFPMTDNFNPRRIERYIVLAINTKIQPVVLLTKSDLYEDKNFFIRQAESVSAGHPVIAVSAYDGSGLDELSPFLLSGTTVIMMGPSGAGKSSLLNALLGETLQREGAIRESDGRGRHTTTSREFFAVPDGALVVDTPGIRELSLLADSSVVRTGFDDIDNLSMQCRFKDCRHESEPGCAVLEAIESGTLEPGRLAGFRKLMKEARFIASRTDARIREEEKRKWKQIGKLQRKFKKEK